MKRFLQCLTLFFLSFGEAGSGPLYAQLPVCNGPGSNLIYYVVLGSTAIYNYNPSLPISATNPSLNSISLPMGGSSTIAVCENLNVSSPSPTFYIVVSGYYYYYNGSTWVNTGHTAGGGYGNGLNIGGGGGYIYNWSVNTDSIYKYDGTANATPLIQASGGPNHIPDIVADCFGNFYIINPDAGWMHQYNSNGGLINTWTVGPSMWYSGDGSFAIVGNKVYFYSSTIAYSNTLWSGLINGSNINVSPIGTFPNIPVDFGSCPVGNNVAIASADTVYYNCNNAIPDTLIGYGASPFTWSVLNGPAIITGTGDTITLMASGNSTILLVSSAFMHCGSDTDTVAVISIPLDTPIISSNSPICTGHNLTLSVNASSSGVSYNWGGPLGFSDTNQNTSRANMVLADSGYYAVIASLNGCTARDSVFVNVKPMPAIPIVNSNSPICAGDSLQLTVSPAVGGISYSWSGPASFSDTGQTPVRINSLLGYSGTYTVVVNLNGCMDTATTNAVVNPTIGPPTISISVSPNDTICTGSSASFTASAGNTGSPVYAWRKNGLNVGTNSTSYTPGAVANGDIFKCKVTSATQCQPIDTALSNTITMNVIAITTPTVSITSQPVIVLANHTDTFYAGITNCLSPGYQWYKNGNKINGATGTMYSGYILAGDQVSVRVHCGGWCEEPDSAVSNVLTALGVPPDPLKGELVIYPNPATTILFVESAIKVNVKIFSIEGKLLLNSNGEKSVDISMIPDGLYIIKVYTDNGELLKAEKLIKQ